MCHAALRQVAGRHAVCMACSRSVEGGEAAKVTGDRTEGSGPVGNTPRLDLDDRARLLDAIEALSALRARHVRDDVVGELVRELGPHSSPIGMTRLMSTPATS